MGFPNHQVADGLGTPCLLVSLEVCSFFGQNRSINRTNLKTYSTIDTGIKIDPVEVCSLFVFAFAGLNAGDWACINAIRDPFTDVSDDGVCHDLLLMCSNLSRQANRACRIQIGSCAALLQLCFWMVDGQPGSSYLVDDIQLES